MIGAAIALAVGAGLRYPGGTLLDPTSSGYSLTHNFLSDLGMTVAYNGQANKLGATLFSLSLLGLVAGFGMTLAGLLRQYLAVPASRRWAIAAALLCPLACLAFAAVAITPENRVMALHVDVTVSAWRLFAVAALLVAVASVRADAARRSRTGAWGLLAVAVTLYAIYLSIGPDVASLDGLRAQVVAQKAITVVAVATLLWLGRYRREAKQIAVPAVAA